MKNKVLKNVVLLACILGVVLFPVTFCYATEYIYNSRSEFCTAINNELSFTANSYTSTYFIDTIGSDYSSLLSSLINNYSLSDDSNFRFLVLCDLGSYKWIYLMAFDNDDYYVYQTDLNSTLPYNKFVFSEATNLDIYDVNSANNTLTYSHRTLNNKTTYNWQPVQKARFAGMYPYNANVKTSSSAVNTFVLNLSDAPDPSTPDFSYVITPIPAQLNAQLFNAYMYARWQEISTKWSNEYANASDFEWVFDNNEDAQLFAGLMGIGSILESYSINSYSFYDNVSQNLANGMIMLSSFGTGINDISDRLAMAFPDDQAELNDSIAETLLDDTNNTGLTTEKVSNAKSDFDDGLSTYEIDTSGSAYSTPFAAIRGGDWSFWSQTTLDNMGSGYSYTYQQTRNTKASNDSDIYEENSKSLFDLLGW